ncbi:PLP-dependent aminotransferase family protein [Paenibacillus glucanolyticus]|jgi:GntR family transcriptional regulator/MocR family aminotransferase|uniref:MocR-like pyridoxine biosynthesis transcription factor PdxR n=1 Tax=Paenibacillus TaxID=44249 RepID=UPI0003E24242|nr:MULTISPECIES: PLP-dependent aminotransferase family protein [Paenibacillus]ANA79134.1 transcriptional regulator [Paenibacillus glucanolyticus]AVV56934.1 PLP-dependent aminotransferase family protein [Paenibacillus glucanolyticus]ETT39285.1 transcriptional regulator [Paenibacillus sp. FSL R5-808]MPY18466.1 PLP-dependent aminotransferase family protein [Paenibacillus glucanolyticus]
MKQVPLNQTEITSALDDSSIPLYVGLYQYIKQEISGGQWPHSARLPSVRKLAELLNVSTTPIEMAYQQLLAEGFIASKPRSGYYVQMAADPPFSPPIQTSLPKGPMLKRHRYFPYDFHMSKNEYQYFPLTEWRKTYNRCLQENATTDMLFYGDPQGEEGLRYQIANYARSFRGVSCTPEQVIIGSDPFPLLDLVSRLLLPYGQTIAVEDPCYPQHPEVFRQKGYDVIPIPVLQDGIHQQELHSSRASFVSVSPSHQFPTGVIMPISRRLSLLQWADETGGFIIEDDSDGEFRYEGRPIPSLQGLLPDSRVIYLGGFSQVLSPALGIQYMILPNALLPDYHQLKFQLFLDCTASKLNQITLERFMREGHVERHLRKMRMKLRRKHDRLINAIRYHFGDRAHISGTGSGFHLMLGLRHPLSEEELQTIAEDRGIRVNSASYTRMANPDHPKEPEHREFILGFGGLREDEIEAGIKLLADCWLGDPRI